MSKSPPNLGLEKWHLRAAYCEGDGAVCQNPRTIARWAERGEIRTMYIGGKAHHHEEDIRRKLESTIRGRNPQRVSA
jgi:hypothetical protein